MTKPGLSILNDDGTFKPFRIELVESSGPVSPKYQYSLNIILYSSGSSIWIDYKNIRKYHKGKPAHPVQFLKETTIEDANKIIRKLSKLDFVTSNSSIDFIGTDRSKVGISFNWLAINLDPNINVRVDYLLSDFDRDEFTDYLKAIEWIKKLGEHLEAPHPRGAAGVW